MSELWLTPRWSSWLFSISWFRGVVVDFSFCIYQLTPPCNSGPIFFFRLTPRRISVLLSISRLRGVAVYFSFSFTPWCTSWLFSISLFRDIGYTDRVLRDIVMCRKGDSVFNNVSSFSTKPGHTFLVFQIVQWDQTAIVSYNRRYIILQVLSLWYEW